MTTPARTWQDAGQGKSAYFDVEVSGSVDVRTGSKWLSKPCTPYETPDGGKSAGPLGLTDAPGWLAVSLAAGSSGGTPITLKADAGDAMTARARIMLMASQSIWVKRSGLPGSGNCIENGVVVPYFMYEFSGSQRLKVTPVPNPLSVSAGNPRPAPLQPVTFTASGGTNIKWQFVPGDTLATPSDQANWQYPISQCTGMATCNYTPGSSGRMYILATADGMEVTQVSGIVWVRSCVMFKNPPNDPSLSDPVFLNTMEDLAKRTGWDQPISQRRERGGWLLRRGGVTEFREFDYGPGMPTTCNSNSYDRRRHYRDQGYQIIGMMHTHPTKGGAEIPAGTCPGQTTPHTAKDGPSPHSKTKAGDLTPWRRPADKFDFPGYALDPDHLHSWENVLDANGNLKLQQNKYDLNKGANACLK
ncbi:MAG TPA: hypothetical protein VGR37_16260 [Longimicrobiaceae bacterium]|nr:hypothetical protein [Longimicrobiaceae bacterium]